MRFFLSLPSLLLCLLALAAGHALALTGADEVRRLAATGQAEAAMRLADASLASNPKDAAMRFAKAVLLADSGRAREAIALYAALSDEQPELAEPYNNIAALYAAAGDYELARAALEQAVRAQPAFAIAHQNLGDVLATLAARAYARALALEPVNPALQGKLALVRELLKTPAPTAVPAR